MNLKKLNKLKPEHKKIDRTGWIGGRPITKFESELIKQGPEFIKALEEAREIISEMYPPYYQFCDEHRVLPKAGCLVWLEKYRVDK